MNLARKKIDLAIFSLSIFLFVTNTCALDTLRTPEREISYGKLIKVCITKNDKYLITVANQGVRIWDVATQQVVASILPDSIVFTTAALAPNDSFIVTSTRNSRDWIFWSIPDGRKIRSFSLVGGMADMKFSPDGKKI